MNSVPPEELVKIAATLEDQRWPLLRQDLHRVFAGFGWKQSESGSYETSFDVSLKHVSALIDKEEDGVNTIGFKLTDRVLAASANRAIIVNDAFVGYVSALADIWGKPTMQHRGRSRIAEWNTASGCRIEIVNDLVGVAFELTSPLFAEVLSRLGQ